MSDSPQSRIIKPTLRDATRFGIAVVGVGGGGGNIVSYMARNGIDDVDFYAVNTDRQALDQLDNRVETIQIGDRICDGEGAGGDPDIARAAAQENTLLLTSKFNEKRLLFIVTCLGGGTGTGASPILANFATRENPGLLTVGIVMTPRGSEGDKAVSISEAGIESLRQEVDAMMIVPNDRDGVGMRARHREVNRLVHEKIEAISSLLVNPQVPNIDMSDLKATLKRADGPAIDMFIGTSILESPEQTDSDGEADDSKELEGQERFDLLLDQALQSDWMTIDFEEPIDEGRGVLSFTLGGEEDDEEIDDITDETSIKQRVNQFQSGASTHNVKIGSFVDPNLPKGTLKATVVLRAAHSALSLTDGFTHVETDDQLDLEEDVPFDPSSLPDATEIEDPRQEAEDFGFVLRARVEETPLNQPVDLRDNLESDTETTRHNRS